MNIYYQHKLIFENISKDEIEIKIKEYLLVEISKYKDLLNRINSLIDNVKKIRPKNFGETKNEYRIFLEEEHNEVLEELKYIGKTYYEDSFEDFYFFDSDGMYLGLLYRDKNNKLEHMSLHPLLIEIPLKIISLTKKEFEIKED